jgi:hypothetical protein
MRRQPIKKHQRGASLFVLQWLVLRALRYVQCDLSSLGYTKVYCHLDSLVRHDRVCPDKFDLFILGPSRSPLPHLRSSFAKGHTEFENRTFLD